MWFLVLTVCSKNYILEFYVPYPSFMKEKETKQIKLKKLMKFVWCLMLTKVVFLNFTFHIHFASSQKKSNLIHKNFKKSSSNPFTPHMMVVHPFPTYPPHFVRATIVPSTDLKR